MIINKKIELLLLLSIMAVSCLTPIDVETKKLGGTLVISGQVSSLSERSFVQLGIVSDGDRLPEPLSAAIVTLIDSEGNLLTYNESFSLPGTYLLEAISGVPGRTYHVEIFMPDGTVYESAPELMPLITGGLETTYEIVKDEIIDFEGTVRSVDFVKIYGDTQIPESSSSSYLRWSVEETFLLSPTDFPDIAGAIPPPCFVSQNPDPQRILLFDGTQSKPVVLENQLIASKAIDWSFLEKHYFTTYLSSLTENAYQYYRKVNIIANQTGSIFDSPPAKISGNIRNSLNQNEYVLGYFQAVNESFDRFALFKSDLPFSLLIEDCSFRGYGVNYQTRCIDCTSLRNSSYARPSWF